MNLHIEPLEHAFFCGTPYSSSEILTSLQNFKDLGYMKISSQKYDRPGNDAHLLKLADFLAYAVGVKNMVFGIFQGKAETGPRALGHRTIVANPTRRDTLDLLNSLVKYREKVRPLAPMMTLAAAKKYFHLEDGASDNNYSAYNFMILAAQAKEGVDKIVPAIVHADNSSRLQIVREEYDLFTHSYLTAMGKYTGVEISVNTSLNVGTPIVQTPKQALEALRKSKGMHGIIFISDPSSESEKPDKSRDIYIAWDTCHDKKSKLNNIVKKTGFHKFREIVGHEVVSVMEEWEKKMKIGLQKEVVQ